jgi:MOSC domain-containing protein YiiM
MTFHSVATIIAVHRGKVAPLGSTGVLSGFVKHAAEDPVQVGPLGLDGAEQADRRVHGGPDKVVYAYPAEHYVGWARDFQGHARLWEAGGVGENLTLAGLVERDVCIGDIFATETGLVLQVTQLRQPCFKLALRFNDQKLPRALVMNGRCGWYYRVVQPAPIAAGLKLSLMRRPSPAWTVARLHEITTSARQMLNAEILREMAGLDGLEEVWRRYAASLVEV